MNLHAMNSIQLREHNMFWGRTLLRYNSFATTGMSL